MNEASGRRLTIVAAVLAGALLLVLFLSRFRGALLILVETAVPAIACAIVVLACYAAGHLALRLAGGPSEPHFVRTFLIGFAAFGTVIGIVAWFSVAPVRIVTILFAVAGIAILWTQRHAMRWPAAISPVAFVLAPAVTIAFVEAITPVFSPDELVYKLAVPHQYQTYGRMIELPLNSNSYLAMAFQLSDLAALTLAGGIAAKLLHFCVYLAALFAAWQLAARWSPRSAWFAAAVLAYTPAVMTISGWAFNEWGVVGLLLFSFGAYEDWVVSHARADLVAAFAAAGGAAAGKYTALPWIAPFAVLVVWRHRRERRVLATAALVAIAFGALFYLRNMVWTGSPVAPFFLPNAPAVANYRSGVLFSGWRDLLTGADVIDRDVTDEALGVLLPLSFIFGLVAFRSRDRANRDLLLVGVVQMVVLLTIAPGSRNTINGVAAVAIPGAVLIGEAWRASARSLKALFAVVIAIAIGVQSITAVAAIDGFGRYLTGAETEEEYIARTRSFTRPYEWIARNTPANARILMIGETRGYYLPRQYVSGGNLDGPRVAAWLGQFHTPDALQRELHAMGVTHVLFHPAWYRVSSPNEPPVSILRRELLLEVPPSTNAVLVSFLRNDTTLRYRDREYVVAELKP